MKRAIVLLLTMMLGACASLAPVPESASLSKLKRDMDAWKGRPVDELVVARGAPTETYVLEGGGRVYEYVQKKVWLKSVSLGALQSNEPQIKARPRKFIEDGKRVEQASVGTNTTQPLNSKVKAPVAVMPCELQFFISANNVIEHWATEGDCN